jgi:hypothetical protein
MSDAKAIKKYLNEALVDCGQLQACNHHQTTTDWLLEESCETSEDISKLCSFSVRPYVRPYLYLHTFT